MTVHELDSNGGCQLVGAFQLRKFYDSMVTQDSFICTDSHKRKKSIGQFIYSQLQSLVFLKIRKFYIPSPSKKQRKTEEGELKLTVVLSDDRLLESIITFSMSHSNRLSTHLYSV